MKKIIIFTCIGGHNTISNALQNSLKNDYQVTIHNIFLNVLHSIDFVRTLSWGAYSTEDLYSFILKKQWHAFMNCVVIQIGYFIFSLRKNSIYRLIFNAIQKEKPDLIISVIPFFNPYFSQVAHDLNIPFILVPTDVDLTTFLYRMNNAAYDKMYVTLPLNDEMPKKQLQTINVAADRIHLTGVALNEVFFKAQDLESIKNQFNIPSHKPVILLLMGSQGSASLYQFAKELAHIKVPFHLIMVLGHNTQQKIQLDTITFPSYITYNIFGFTPYVPQLMAVSDLLITKSGGISVCEAFYMNLPMLLDATTEILMWERLNQDFVVKNKLGTIVSNLSCLAQQVTTLLTDRQTLLSYKENLKSFEKKNGNQEIKKLIKRLLH